MNKYLMTWVFAFLASALSTAANADAFANVSYDGRTDEIVVNMIYRGTNPNHTFTLQWDPCPEHPDSRQRYEVGAKVLDAQWNDAASQPFRKAVRFTLADLKCRPAQVTLWTAPRFRYTIVVPRAPKKLVH